MGARSSRRRLCLGVAAWAAAPSWRLARAATQRVGFISGGDADGAADFLAALGADLARRGHAQPESLAFDARFADGDLARVPTFVTDLEQARAAVIVTHAIATTLVVQAPRKVPVVYEFSADPVAAGIAADLAHPLFNATGITLMLAELNGKRLDLFKQILPDMRRVGVLANALHPGQERERAVVEDEARQQGLRTSAYTMRSEADLDAALAALASAPPEGLLVLSDGFVVTHRRKILDFALARRLPVISGWAIMADSGALCTYGPRLAESFARVGYFVDRILKGAAPSALPIEQPTILELVINLKTARQLGLSVPTAVLARADHVIE
jgi:putative tryptophan/tyrosine transport system substrate-binding protein